jgi:hypothetical protein
MGSKQLIWKRTCRLKKEIRAIKVALVPQHTGSLNLNIHRSQVGGEEFSRQLL